VLVGDTNIINYIKGDVSSDSFLRLSFSSSLPDYSYYHTIGIGVEDFSSGVYNFKLKPAYLSTFLIYVESCCFQLPDQTTANYKIDTNALSTNYVIINFDKTNKRVSGMFDARLINEFEPYDSLHIHCDTFRCSY
jgi:hypothetical protein